MDVAPKEITVTRGGASVQVGFVGRVPTGATVASTQLTPEKQPGVSVNLTGPEPAPPTKDDMRWHATVSVDNTVPEKGVILFSFSCVQTEAKRHEAGSRVSLVPVPFTARSPTKPLSGLKLRVDTMGDPIDTKRAGTLNLTLENVGDQDLADVSIRAVFPSFLATKPRALGIGSLAAGTSRIVSFRVDQVETPDPGLPQPVFEVRARAAGETEAGVTVVAANVPLTVLGVSDALKLIQVPSFLFLPGALLLLTCDLIWRLRVADKNDGFPLAWSSPAFWLIAVTVSMPVAFLYPAITGIFGRPRDYLIVYTLTDVILVWFSSIVMAVPAYAIGACIRAKWEASESAKAKRQQRARDINTDDQPTELLRKLVQMDLLPKGIVFRAVLITNAYLEQRVFDTGVSGDHDRTWLLPDTVITLHDDSRAGDLDRALGQASDLESVRSLIDVLEELGPAVRVIWVKGPLIDRPTLWLAKDTKSAGGVAPLLMR